ncbi:MAG: ABC transporter substrate-binding protein [Treponema sp.]|jgi:ABC-type nitrate/sulfonate/bicarbonate transport system substrate-binding protein|nr:ABC transporter substrate-binding protein [Treponema sp.]
MKPIKPMMPLVLAALSALLFCGCGKGVNNNGGENGPERIRFVLDWSPNTNHTGLYAAQDRGWFAEENLAVEILSPPEDGALLLLGSGRAEFAVDVQEGLGPAIGREDPLPVQAVAAVISHNSSGLMSLTSAGIKRPRDLAGKRFASWGTPLVTAVIRDIVEGDGGDFAAVKMIPNNAVDAFSALETDVDSIWIYYAWDGIAAEIRGTETDFLDLGTINPELDFYTPVIVVNTDWADAHPETAKRFLKALSRGYEFAMANPGEAADILLKYAPELDAALVRRSQDYLASRYRGDAPRWGEIDERRWSAFYQWMYQRRLLDKDIGSGGFTNGYLP